MNIKTWEERREELIKNGEDEDYIFDAGLMQKEINELRAERDAQRKVLEQALESLELCSIYAYAGGVGSTASKHKKAITAIQEQLNEHN